MARTAAGPPPPVAPPVAPPDTRPRYRGPSCSREKAGEGPSMHVALGRVVTWSGARRRGVMKTFKNAVEQQKTPAVTTRTFNSFKEAASAAQRFAQLSRGAVRVVRRGSVWIIQKTDGQHELVVSAANASQQLHPRVDTSRRTPPIASASLTRVEAATAKPKGARRFVDNDGFAGSREAHKAMRGWQRGSKL